MKTDLSSIDLPGLITWKKDLNLTFIECNEAGAKLLGFNRIDGLIGRTNYEVACKAVEWADCFRQQDKRVIEVKSEIKTLELHPYYQDNVWKIMLCTKFPIYDNSQLIVGIGGYCVDATVLLGSMGVALAKTNVQLSKQKSLAQTSYMLTSAYQEQAGNPALTNRELECLFFVLRGKTIKQIAQVLKLSPRTIEDYLEKLKTKFKCHSKSELIEKTIASGLLNVIPESMLSQNVSTFIVEK